LDSRTRNLNLREWNYLSKSIDWQGGVLENQIILDSNESKDIMNCKVCNKEVELRIG
jgi:hypothetical protein